jgi:hypothetical protein
VLATVEGDRATERAIHQHFAHLRFPKTEQFEPGPDLMEFLGEPWVETAGQLEPMASVRTGLIGMDRIDCNTGRRKKAYVHLNDFDMDDFDQAIGDLRLRARAWRDREDHLIQAAIEMYGEEAVQRHINLSV